MKKGSAAVNVIIVSAFAALMTLAISLLVSDGWAMTYFSKRGEQASYICEAGLERSASIIINDMSQNIESLALNSDTSEPADIALLKNRLDDIAVPYFKGFSSGRIINYQKFTGSDGRGIGNGYDTIMFSKFTSCPSFYKIISIALKQTKLKFEDNILKYDITYDICMSGNINNSYKEINSEYTVSFSITADNKPGDDKRYLSVENADHKVIYWKE